MIQLPAHRQLKACLAAFLFFTFSFCFGCADSNSDPFQVYDPIDLTEKGLKPRMVLHERRETAIKRAAKLMKSVDQFAGLKDVNGPEDVRTAEARKHYLESYHSWLIKRMDKVAESLKEIGANEEYETMDIRQKALLGDVLHSMESLNHDFSKRAIDRRIEATKFKRVLLALHKYEQKHRSFPFFISNEDSNELKERWQVRVLPFLNQESLFNELMASSDPESLADTVPTEYGAPGKFTFRAIRLTPLDFNKNWQRDPDHDMQKMGEVSFPSIQDGSSNTIMMVAHPNGSGWMENSQLTIDEAVELVVGLEQGQTIMVGCYDGAIRYLRAGIEAEQVRNLFSPRDGQICDIKDYSDSEIIYFDPFE